MEEGCWQLLFKKKNLQKVSFYLKRCFDGGNMINKNLSASTRKKSGLKCCSTIALNNHVSYVSKLGAKK